MIGRCIAPKKIYYSEGYCSNHSTAILSFPRFNLKAINYKRLMSCPTKSCHEPKFLWGKNSTSFQQQALLVYTFLLWFQSSQSKMNTNVRESSNTFPEYVCVSVGDCNNQQFRALGLLSQAKLGMQPCKKIPLQIPLPTFTWPFDLREGKLESD